MALGLLCVGLILMGALKMQAQYALPTFIPAAPLSKFPLQPVFNHEKFQGKWYAVGWATSTERNESLSETALHSATYELNDDLSYNVTTEWFRNNTCSLMSDTIFPLDQSGAFTLENVTRYSGLQELTLRVLETNYNQFALVLLNMTSRNKPYMEHILYGRTKRLSHKLKGHYRNVTILLGLPAKHIFTDPWVECVN